MIKNSQERERQAMYDDQEQEVRACVYARSATLNQRAIDQQIGACTEYCMKRGYLLSQEHIYTDSIRSTGILDRPQLKTLREAMRRGDFDVVVVFSLDKLGRSVSLIQDFIDETERCGVRLETALEEQFHERRLNSFLRARQRRDPRV